MQPEGPPTMSLVEIGPRFVLTPIKIFEGAFNGAVVYRNERRFTPISSFRSRPCAEALQFHPLQNSSHPLSFAERDRIRRWIGIGRNCLLRRIAMSEGQLVRFRRTNSQSPRFSDKSSNVVGYKRMENQFFRMKRQIPESSTRPT